MIEDVLDTLKAELVAHLATEIGRQEAKYTALSDGVSLGTVSDIQLGNANPSAIGLPAVILQPTGMTVEIYCSKKKDVTHEIHIGVAVTDTDEDVAFKKLWRTMRAVECCLEINAPGSSPIIDFKIIQVEYLSKLFEIDDSTSPEKTGIITARVSERLDAYVSTQL